MSVDKFKEILDRASLIAGTDLNASYHAKRDPESIEEIRASLPNSRSRKQFDKEIKTAEKRATNETASQRAYKHRKSNKRALAKLEKQLKAAGIANPDPKLIPSHLWKQTQHILADASGWAAKYYSRLCWHRIAVSLIHRAALCYVEDNQPKYSYIGTSREAQRARYVLAVGLLLVGLSTATGRRNQGWMRLVRGIPQAAILAALRDPFTGAQLHRNALDGCHRVVPKIVNQHTGKSKPAVCDGRVGYLTALASVGLFYTRQLIWREGEDPTEKRGWDDLKPEEHTGEAHNGLFTSLNRYWIVADQFTDPADEAKRAELYVAWLAGSAYPEIVDSVTFAREVETSVTYRESPS